METLEQGRRRNPEHIASYFYAAQAHELLARRLRNRGQDPAPHLAQAIALHRAGIAINDQIAPLHNGLGVALLAQAQAAWDRGQEPWPFLDQAQAAFERATAVAPAQPFGYNNVGEVHVWRARYQHALGLDVEASARAAELAYGQALAHMPGNATFLANLAQVSEVLAARALERGQDPGAFLARGARDVDAALRRNPEHATGWRQHAELQALRIQWQARHQSVPGQQLDQVVRAFERAIALVPDELAHRVALARFYRWWASWHQATGRDSALPLAQGLGRLDEALAVWPGHAEAQALHADLLRLRAEQAEHGERRDAWLQQARGELRAAIMANAHLAPRWEPELRRIEQLAAGHALDD
jgi:serine/threonine-protein kinase